MIYEYGIFLRQMYIILCSVNHNNWFILMYIIPSSCHHELKSIKSNYPTVTSKRVTYVSHDKTSRMEK